jgi:GNAT superfamily N-acetyltransferase
VTRSTSDADPAGHGLTLLRWSDAPALHERVGDEVGAAWPEYNLHGDVLRPRWGRLYEEHPTCQLIAYDERLDRVVGEANSVPCRWDGTVEGLPRGIDAVVAGAFDAGEAPGWNAHSALAIQIAADQRGRRLSGVLIEALCRVAAEHGATRLLAPLRPTGKERYPITPIERYAAWTRADGAPFDPWIRLHVRLGARILHPEPASLRITGTVAEWEEWTGLAFPESGTYTFPRGLAPLEVDVDADRGAYWEPNVWVVHAAAGAG